MRRPAIAVLLTLALAACGGSTAPDAAPAVTTQPAAPTTTVAPPDTSIPATTAPVVTAPATTAPATTAPVVTAPVVTVPVKSAALTELTITQPVAPVHLRLDSQSIDADVVPVSASAETAELLVPPTHAVLGWYQYGVTPGDAGSAVLAGHVDWKGQLGAFYDLIDVAVGDQVVVTLADGRQVAFTVTSNEQIAKVDLPLDRVFRHDGPPQLVLITCGGYFNRTTRHYDDNIVVFATPTPV
jgi:LPXTG-site transpeptidase (sortase) family protein